jgi:hypothetical protein
MTALLDKEATLLLELRKRSKSSKLEEKYNAGDNNMQYTFILLFYMYDN